jgi:glucose-1-phosphate thymidylyltransferase
MKGIVLAGGSGSRLRPMTTALSKQLMPIYDKPMIHYPISTLMLAGVREFLIITAPDQEKLFKSTLGNGERIGIDIQYKSQPQPNGIAEALIIGEKFIENENSILILGDNIFYGVGMGHDLTKYAIDKGAHILTKNVNNPQDFGVLILDENNNPKNIVEKPLNSKSKLAITGLYFFDSQASSIAKEIKPSPRGELEITEVLNFYLKNKTLKYTELPRGTVWLDTGTPMAMLEASLFMKVIEERTSMKIACLEEIAWRSGWINDQDIEKIALDYGQGTSYGAYLQSLIR